MPDRTFRRLFAGGIVYAVTVRGIFALVGLPPGLGYNPELIRYHSGAAGWIFGICEVAVDLTLPALAVYWAVVGFSRRSPAATRAFALVLLVDNVIYIGSMLMVPADIAGGSAFDFMVWLAALQGPLIVICVNVLALTFDRPVTARGRRARTMPPV